eukprot:517552_1
MQYSNENRTNKKIISNGDNLFKYGITDDLSITSEHICAVKLYTDYSGLCKIFCEAFRLKKISNHQYERIQSVKKRNEKIANWCRLLMTSVQCYGTLMAAKKRYYRGINKEFIFQRFITRFNAPLSTTTDFKNATRFAGDGLVMELTRYNSYISGLDCSKISEFDEKEVLFFGGDSIFYINSIYQWYNNEWTSYRKYIVEIQCLMDIAHGIITW